MGLESKGFRMHISGPEGHETYMLTYKGRLVGGGDLRKTLATSKVKTAARQRLAAFEKKNHTLTQPEARLRMFQLETRLTENDATQHRP
jgi:hypothetical protein